MITSDEISGEEGAAKQIQTLRGTDYFAILLQQRRIILFTIVFFMFLAVIARFVLPAKYEATTTLSPNSSELSFNSPMLGSLMSLGIMPGAGEGSKRAVAIATLQSRPFIEQFIRTEHLEPILFPSRWDELTKTWRGAPPTSEEGYNALAGAIYVDTTPTDVLVRLRVRWTDPERAAWIANHMVSLLNRIFQNKAVLEADRMIGFLNKSYQQTSIEEVRNSLGNLIVDQTKQRILAQSRDDYSLAVVARAEPSSKRVSPGLSILLPAALFLGLLLGIPLAFLSHVYSPLWRGPTWRGLSLSGARWRISWLR